MVQDTLKGLELGAVETLVVWENLDVDRITLVHNATGRQKILHLSKAQQGPTGQLSQSYLKVDGELYEETERVSLVLSSVSSNKAHSAQVEWFANNYRSFGTTLEFITNRSQEGSQFCRGFGGIGGILRWRVDFMEMMADDDDDETVM